VEGKSGHNCSENIALQYIVIAKRYLIRNFLFVNFKLSLTAFKGLDKKNPPTLHEIRIALRRSVIHALVYERHVLSVILMAHSF
jgi:hypothetical protein